MEQERLEALRETEERRKEKHRKMEEERENMRQGIRDKVSLKLAIFLTIPHQFWKKLHHIKLIICQPFKFLLDLSIGKWKSFKK